ncbi:MAG: SIS domain-containing protein [Archaeoglobaceae archaeon]
MQQHGLKLATARRMIEDEIKVLENLLPQLDERLVKVAELIMHCKGKVLVVGSGTSRYIAERFAHLAACCKLPVFFLHPCDALHGSSGAINKDDVLLAISKGGETSEVNEIAKIAKTKGAVVLALTGNEKSSLVTLSDYVIVIESEGADPYGVLACGSSLAHAAVTDAICAVILAETGLNLKEFAEQHPRGAVGLRLRKGGEAI